MGGGILVSLPFFQFGLGKLKAPLFADVFRLPTRTDIDGRLIGGAALFGIGWGLVGLKDGLHFMNAEHRGQFMFILCPDQFENGPISFESKCVEEFDASVGNLHGTRRPL